MFRHREGRVRTTAPTQPARIRGAGHSSVDYFGGDWKLAKSADFCLTEGGMLKPFDGTNEMHG